MTYGSYFSRSWFRGNRSGSNRWSGRHNSYRNNFRNSWSWRSWQKSRNTEPEAKDDYARVMEDAERSTVFNVLKNDSDRNGDELKITSFNNGNGIFGEWFKGDNGGEFCLLENGCVDFRPGDSEFNHLAKGEIAYTSFTYTISDGKGGYSTATAKVKVVGENDAPTAVADEATTDVGQAITIDVLANDVDVDGDDIAIASVADPDGGSVQIVDGQLVYTPDADFVGTDIFEYTITDEDGLTSTEQVTVTVTGNTPNPEPILRDGMYQLANHPDSINSSVGDGREWGLRLDGLTTDNKEDIFTFDFEHPGSKVIMTIDGDSIHISGKVYGGLVENGVYSSEQSGYWNVDFTYDNLDLIDGDDDFVINAFDENGNRLPQGQNTGTIEALFDASGSAAGLFNAGDSFNFEDFAGKGASTKPYTFQLGNKEDDTGIRGFKGVSGTGWFTQDGVNQKASDWLFTVKEPDPILPDGTYKLCNHPDSVNSFIGDGQAWGLRLDGLTTDNADDVFTFDFEHPGSKMYMTIEGDSVRIFGEVYGGLTDAGVYDTDQSGFWEVDFTYNNVNTVPGDDDLAVDKADQGQNIGLIKPLFDASGTADGLFQAGDEFSMEDFAGFGNSSKPYTFQLGDKWDDKGIRGFKGITGTGWFTQDGVNQKASDWLFSVKETPVEPPKEICAELVGDTELDEGETGNYKIQLSGESSADRTFTLEVTNGTAQRVNQEASGQDIMWGGRYDVRYGVGGQLAYEVFNRVPNGTQISDGDRPMVGPGDASWDYTVYQEGEIQTDTITLMVPAGETMSDSFDVKTWLEKVMVDRDSGNATGYDEMAETFSIRVIDSATDVCVDHLEVTINDRTDYDFVSPISIDLNGNGIETLSINQGITFDLLNTGTKVNTGWLSSGDGFLAVDTNGNGQIDDRSELFGGSVGEGFAKLATFDSNSDGWVDVADAAFAKLSIWQDANSNGETDAGELLTPASAGISSLKVDYDKTFTQDAQGNILGERSVALTTGGTALDMVDVYFQVG